MAKRSSSRSLFPDAGSPIEPSPDRPDPTVWVRRLAVVARRSPDAEPLREVEFRRGLNVVHTAPRPAGESRVVSHSVGKTLLLRLIRYCLGEAHCAKPAVAEDLRAALPEAHVLAEVAVAGAWWVVVRPLRDARPSESWAVPAGDWRAGLGDPAGLRRYGEFLEAVSGAVLSGLPPFVLPMANHPPRWVDVLGWVARDNECKYLHPNVWRHEEAGSGTPPLDRRDASLLMSWVTGLLDLTQITEIARRRDLTRRRNEAAAEVGRCRRRLEALEPLLTVPLGLTADQLAGGMFDDGARKRIEEERASLERLLAEQLDADPVGRAQEALTDAVAAVRVAERELENERAWLEAADRELWMKERPPAGGYDDRLDPTRCPLRGQPACIQNRPAGGPVQNPDAEAEAGRIRQRRDLHRRRVEELEAALPAQREAAAGARAGFAAAVRERDARVSGIRESVGRWRLLGEQLDEYDRTKVARDEARQTVERLGREIAASVEAQKAARGRRTARHRTLSAVYDHTLRAILGPVIGGAIRLQARGLHPDPDRAAAANGDAIGFLGRVLAFDLACLAGTVCGVGSLPGFWLHDSPNTVEMEPALYERIFRFVLALERASGDRPPAFQYILTTSGTPPPDVLNGEYVRLTLDARDPAGLLLRTRF